MTERARRERYRAVRWTVAAALAAFTGLATVPVGRRARVAEPPLPDAPTFLAEARKNLASDSYLQSRFTYKERETTVKMNPFGHMGTGDVLVYEVRPDVDPPLTYRRLIERNGVPLTAEELAEEDRKHDQKVREYRRTRANEGASQREQHRKEEAAARAREHRLVGEVVGLFNFKLVGRATVDGVPSVVVQFAPKPDAKPNSRDGRIAAAFVGRAWVGEASHQVVRVEAESQHSVSFAAGFVKLNKGLKVTATRREIDGTWLPVKTTFVGHGRAFFFRTFDLDLVWEYFDYKRIEPPVASGSAGPGKR